MMGSLQERIDHIILHHSDSPQFRGDDAVEIHRWHERRGFDGIGYHWVILEDGTRQAGRPWYWKGAHAAEGGHNHNSLGILLIGRGDFTDAQMRTLAELYQELKATWPRAEWKNHRDVDPGTECPGIDLARIVTGH